MRGTSINQLKPRLYSRALQQQIGALALAYHIFKDAAIQVKDASAALFSDVPFLRIKETSNVSLLCTALYASCPYYIVLCLQVFKCCVCQPSIGRLDVPLLPHEQQHLRRGCTSNNVPCSRAELVSEHLFQPSRDVSTGWR